MALHRFREHIQPLAVASQREAFVPCPVALLQILSPQQQSVAQRIYEIARQSIQQERQASRWLIEFSLN